MSRARTFRPAAPALWLALAAVAAWTPTTARAAEVCTDFDGDGTAETCIVIDDDVPDDDDDLPEEVHLPDEAPPEVPPVEGEPVEEPAEDEPAEDEPAEDE